MRLRLTRFSPADKIATETGNPTLTFTRWINDAISNISASVNDIGQLLADVTLALEQAGIAVAQANDALDQITAQKSATDIVNSYVNPSAVMSAATDGATAKIVIIDHQRIYGDGTTVDVLGATISGLAYATNFYVTYRDPAREGGAVVFETTTDSGQAGQSGDRHLVGGVSTPSDSTATDPVEGGGTRPPGVPAWKFQEDLQ